MATTGQQQQQNVTVQAKLAGLPKMKAEWLDFMGNMLTPVAILASGGTKTAAAWGGMRDVFLTKVLGPIGMVAGAATSFLLVTKKLVSEWKTLGMTSSKEMERLTVQFKPLLGSMAAAKKRAKEIFEFGRVSPFETPDVATGGKMLESLTKGALTGKAGMTLVGDAAAVAGTGFTEMSQTIGRLYDGLQSGRPVGMVAQRLQELGVISGETRNQIEAMQAANVAGAEVWKVAEKDIARVRGAMADANGTLAQLESAYRDTQMQMQAGFSNGFMEGEKAGMESSIKLMERMTPVATNLGEMFGMVSNAWAKFKAWVVDGITSVPLFGKVITGVTYAVIGLAGAITLAAGASIGKFIVGLISATQASAQLAAAVGSVSAAQKVGATVTSLLTAAKASLATVSAAVKAGNYAEAASALKLAAANTLAAIRTNGLAAAHGILGGVLSLTGKAVMFVTRSIWAMSVAIFSTPIGIISALLVIAGGAMMYFANEAKKAREELEALEEASRSVVSSLKQQVMGIRTVAEQRRAEVDIVAKLAEAYRDLTAAQTKGDKAAESVARKRIKDLKVVKADAEKVKPEKPAEEMERDAFMRQAEKEAKRTREGIESGAGEDSALKVARRQQEEGDSKKAAEEKMIRTEAALAQRQDEARRAIADSSMRKGELEARRMEARKIVDAGAGARPGSAAFNEAGMAASDVARYDRQLEAMAAVKAAENARVSEMAISGGSELAALKEKLNIYGELALAAGDWQKAHDRVMSNTGSKGDPKELAAAVSDLNAAADRKRAAAALAQSTGVSEWGPQDRQAADARATQITSERNANIDPNAAAERDHAVKMAEQALVQARLDAESQILSFKLKGYDKEKMLLAMEREKLEMMKRGSAMDETRYQRQKAVLAAQEAAAAKAAGERKDELQGALEISKLRRMESAARTNGNPAAAEALRKGAEAREVALSKKQAEKEAGESNMGGHARQQYVQQRMEEDRQAREQERQQRERDLAQGRKGSTVKQTGAVGAIREQILRMKGKNSEADALQEKNARKQDDVDREDARQGYVQQGFTADKAKQMADTDVKTAQGQRLMEKLTGDGSAKVVASSLAEIGGGGNTYGGSRDKSEKLLESIEKILEQVRDQGKTDLDAW